jgi:DNA-binding transcriptional regulator LsrR (DeoR family)
MRRPKDYDSQLDMLTAAYLLGQEHRQTDIAGQLGISQAAVSRLLAEAKRQKYLRREFCFLKENVAPGMLEQIEQRLLRKPLVEALGEISRRRAPHLTVFPCTAADRGKRMTELTGHAAHTIRDLILRCHSFGVTWGGMLSRVPAALRALPVPAPWTESPIEVIPLSGEPLGDNPTTYSSSSIAHAFGQAVNGEKYNARSLAMVPAFVPDGFTKSELAAVWKLIGLVQSHADIFGLHDKGEAKDGALASHVDMILTSVGTAERPFGFGKGTLFATGKVTLPELTRLVLGELGGACIPRPGLTKQQAARLESVARRWTGLTRRHLEECARRATEHSTALAGPPGIVVVSVGRERAEFLVEAVLLGLVNRLIVDDELQEAMEDLIRKRWPRVWQNALKQEAPGAPIRDSRAPSGRPGRRSTPPAEPFYFPDPR